MIGLAGLGALYHWRARQRPANGATLSPTPGQRATFYSALALIFLSLNGWLHDLSDGYLFSAHMVQHLVLTLVAPPLLDHGHAGLDAAPRARAGAASAPVARWLTAPTRCFVDLQRRARRVAPAADVRATRWRITRSTSSSTCCFMAAAVLMWWPVLSPLPELPRLSYPGQMLYLFLLSIPMSIVAVCIGYADHVLYPCVRQRAAHLGDHADAGSDDRRR